MLLLGTAGMIRSGPANFSSTAERSNGSLLGSPSEGLTLVPLRMYFRDGKAKMELALAKGRTKGDKRQVIREREERREMERGIRRVGRRPGRF